MEIKKIAKIAGKIGAALLGLGGLIMAGKSGFGEDLKFGGAAEPVGDLADSLVDLDADTSAPEETLEPDPTEEEETSDE